MGSWDSKVLMPAEGEWWQEVPTGILTPSEVQSFSPCAAEARLDRQHTPRALGKLEIHRLQGLGREPRAGSGILLVLDATGHREPRI